MQSAAAVEAVPVLNLQPAAHQYTPRSPNRPCYLPSAHATQLAAVKSVALTAHRTLTSVLPVPLVV